MKTVGVKTDKPKQVVDITDIVEGHLANGVVLCHLFLLHTTAALATADLDPGTDLDMLDAFEKIIPQLNYRHPHDPSHVPDHILSSIIGTSLWVPAKDGELILGSWQRIVLIEFSGPRERNLVISCSSNQVTN